MRVTLQEAAHLLQTGHVVAVPTETVYGLAAPLGHPGAVEAIFRLKGRPSNNPLIVHVSGAAQIIPFARSVPKGFHSLAEAFWPGPMTLVLPANEGLIPSKVRAGLATAAFRVPAHPLACGLLRVAGALVMPSANLSGKPSATSPGHVEADFGPDFPVLDGGACSRGLESTILAEKDGAWRIIRQGALPPEAFESVLGYAPEVDSLSGGTPLCPGQLYRHYAPAAELRLTRAFSEGMEGVALGYAGRNYPASLQVVTLGPLDGPDEVAENLYSALRKLDEDNIPYAWVDVNIPDNQLWRTIFERLVKASKKS